jgi:hypothetical protein
MKLRFLPLLRDEEELIASWGEAELIRYLDGKCELRGGSEKDRAEAREWMSLFWQGAVVGEASTLIVTWAVSLGGRLTFKWMLVTVRGLVSAKA